MQCILKVLSQFAKKKQTGYDVWRLCLNLSYPKHLIPQVIDQIQTLLWFLLIFAILLCRILDVERT